MKYLPIVCLVAIAFGRTSTAGAQAESTGVSAELIKLEKQSWDAWKARDGKFYKTFLSDDHVEMGPSGPANKAEVVATVASPMCKVASWSADSFHVTLFSPTSALLTYHAAQNTLCHDKPIPSPVWVSSLYVKRGGRWVNALYQQTPVPPHAP